MSRSVERLNAAPSTAATGGDGALAWGAPAVRAPAQEKMVPGVRRGDAPTALLNTRLLAEAPPTPVALAAGAIGHDLEPDLLAHRDVDPAGHPRQIDGGVAIADEGNGEVGEPVGPVEGERYRRLFPAPCHVDLLPAAQVGADDVEEDVAVAVPAGVVDDRQRQTGRCVR